jgi:hypothetical protein
MSQEGLPRGLTDRLERLERKIDVIGTILVIGAAFTASYVVDRIIEGYGPSPAWRWLTSFVVVMTPLLVYGYLLKRLHAEDAG